jgi:hypothetical protein
MISPPNFPMVMVHWVDAAMSATAHWQDGDKPEPPKGRPMHECFTVGWLVYTDDEWIQVLGTSASGYHSHSADIPRGMVKSLVVLKPVVEKPPRKR